MERGGASHLISGHGKAHQLLEEQLAEFDRPRALLFPRVTANVTLSIH